MANSEHLKTIEQGVATWNAWRKGTPEVKPDLRRAKLGRVNLRRANLSKVDLSGADLSRALLEVAGLSFSTLLQTNLTGANLRAANLSHANLSGSDLSNADLSGARLFGTNFSDANLSAADFSKALMGHTIFARCDLRTVKGLSTVSHIGPSTVSVDTMYVSDGQIPEVFFRGVGLPDGFLTYLPSLTARPIEFYSCFISYSHGDRAFARRLHDTLQGRGIRCWLDEHELLPGDKIYTEVDRGIRLWDKVLLCCSKDALTSWWVDNEIKIAFDKEQRLWRERGEEVFALIPLNLDDYLLSEKWQSGLATEVKARMAANFTGWEHDNKIFETQLERLVKALRTDRRGTDSLPPRLL